MAPADDNLSFSPVEVGLLTVAERRGSVRTPRIFDERNEPALVERLTVLSRLVERGFMRRTEVGEAAADFEFAMTDAGREALKAADRARLPPEH